MKVSRVSIILVAALLGTALAIMVRPTPADAGVNAVVAFARAQVGKPYRYGATGPNAYDCSGLVMAAWRHGGKNLPHGSRLQYAATRRILRSQLQPGDLVFYYSPVRHVALYVGGGMEVAATHTGSVVKLRPLGRHVSGYGRVRGVGVVHAMTKPVSFSRPRTKAVRHHKARKHAKKLTGLYVVRSGDTLCGLVGSRWPAVARANRLRNPDLIFPGQHLYLGAVVPHRHVKYAHKPRHRTKAVHHHGRTVWDRLVMCEAGGNWAANTGNGFYGGLQFVLSTWRANGGYGMPYRASREQQIAVATRVLASQGWGAWPACSRKLGLR